MYSLVIIAAHTNTLYSMFICLRKICCFSVSNDYLRLNKSQFVYGVFNTKLLFLMEAIINYVFGGTAENESFGLILLNFFVKL